MLKIIAQRLIFSVGVFFVVALGLFLLTRLAPGDPVDMMIPIDLPPEGREQFEAAMRARLGLDQPLPVQFAKWFGELLQGNLGISYARNTPVSELLASRFSSTLMLTGIALIVGLAVATPLGILAAMKRTGIVDRAVTTLSVGVLAVPGFFLAMVLIYVFAVKLRLLPSSGMHSSGRDDLADLIAHMIMPVGMLALGVVASFFRYVRSAMITELDKDYIRAVIAKGAGPMLVVTHAFRNGSMSLLTVVAMYVPTFLAGAVVVEQIFSWPGMGQLAVQAVTTRDYPVVIGFGLYVAVIVLVCNLIADLLYVVVDPRVRKRQ